MSSSLREGPQGWLLAHIWPTPPHWAPLPRHHRQMVAKDGKAQEAESNATAAEASKAASTPAQMGKSPSSALQKGNMEGCSLLVTIAEIPPEGWKDLGFKVTDVAKVAMEAASP
jgi:hypothetical protein